MAFLLDSDPTSTTFNCYVSVDEATTYFEARFGAEKWLDESFSENQKIALLATASREIDSMRFAGKKTSNTQPMSWPRDYLQDWDGDQIPVTLIPQALKDAVCELALWKWTEGDRWFSDDDLGQISNYKVPGVEVTAKSNPQRFPNRVNELLESIGPGVVSTSSGKAKSGRIGL